MNCENDLGDKVTAKCGKCGWYNIDNEKRAMGVTEKKTYANTPVFPPRDHSHETVVKNACEECGGYPECALSCSKYKVMAGDIKIPWDPTYRAIKPRDEQSNPLIPEKRVIEGGPYTTKICPKCGKDCRDTGMEFTCTPLCSCADGGFCELHPRLVVDPKYYAAAERAQIPEDASEHLCGGSLNCLQCGKELTSGGSYCNTACYDAHKEGEKMLITKPCTKCGSHPLECGCPSYDDLYQLLMEDPINKDLINETMTHIIAAERPISKPTVLFECVEFKLELRDYEVEWTTSSVTYTKGPFKIVLSMEAESE
jgi:hypothetical protein